MIPYGRQTISEDDIQKVVEVLRSDFITQGPILDNFEKILSSEVKVNFSVASNSATSSLLISCLALGLNKGDILWTSPNSFVASSNCALHCGAKIDFVDIEINTGNMCVEKLEEKLIIADKKNTLPKIVIPVHFAGQPTDQEKIWELSIKYGFKIIEDASHSLGASRDGELVGSCKWSDITVFSFHPVKMITSCEGGMSVTNNKKLYESMLMLRTHGITKNHSEMINDVPGPWYYEQQLLGFNFRMSDVHAALGLSQLSKLKIFTQERNIIAERYNNKLKSYNIQLPTIKDSNYCSFHLYVINLENKENHLRVFNDLRQNNIGVNVHYIPIHLHPYYKKLGFKEGDYKECESFSSRAISIPMYPSLSIDQQDHVIKTIINVL